MGYQGQISELSAGKGWEKLDRRGAARAGVAGSFTSTRGANLPDQAAGAAPELEGHDGMRAELQLVVDFAACSPIRLPATLRNGRVVARRRTPALAVPTVENDADVVVVEELLREEFIEIVVAAAYDEDMSCHSALDIHAKLP